METNKEYFKKELFSLSTPIILSRLINLLSDIINGLLVAKLGIIALASYTLGISTFTTFYLICVSMLFSVGISVSRALSIQQDISSVMSAGLLLATILAVFFSLGLEFSSNILILFKQNSQVVINTTPYFRALMYGIFPNLWSVVLSQYLIGMKKPHIVTWILLTTLPINVIIAYILIFNKLGNFPLLGGIAGAGYAASMTAWLRLFVMLYFLCLDKKFLIMLKESLHFSRKHLTSLKKLYVFGWPLAVQYGGEVAILTAATYLIGHLDYRYLAAQQISSQFRLISMMIPFGIAQAVSIIISREIASEKTEQARYNSVIALRSGLIIISISIFLVILFSNSLIRLYIPSNSENQAIFHLAKVFLYFAAAIQLFDTIKIILGGVLRGYGDTKIPMYLGLFALGAIGLSLGYYLGYVMDFGVMGILIGNLIGFLVSASLLFGRFNKINIKVRE